MFQLSYWMSSTPHAMQLSAAKVARVETQERLHAESATLPRIMTVSPLLLCGGYTQFDLWLVIYFGLLQGGLTDLWLDDPYVIAAKKLIAWATEENLAGKVFPVCMFSAISCTAFIFAVQS